MTSENTNSSEEETPEDSEFFSEEMPDSLEDIFNLFSRKETTFSDEDIPVTKCTREDMIKLILVFYLKHNLSWQGLEDLLLMFNTIFDKNTFPKSKHCFKKLFLTQTPEIHICCNRCNLYLGKKEDIVENITCINCNESFSIAKSKKFFVYYNIRDQIKDILTSTKWEPGLQSSLESENITDVHDGLLYKKFKEKHADEINITLTVNTDGANVFKSKKHGSLWPVQAIINELSPKIRFDWKNLILSGIWFGADPDMIVYLNPMIEEINYIAANPIKLDINGTTVLIKVSPLLFAVDSMARYLLQEKTQHNSYKGCSYCEHPGEFFLSLSF